MKILFGIPDVTHRELADLEISGIKELIPDCDTIHYGPVKSKKASFFNKIIDTVKNANAIKKSIKKNSYDLVFLNTSFDFNAVIRDYYTYFILRNLKVKVFLKLHGSDLSLLKNSKWYKQKLAKGLLNKVSGFGVLSNEEKSSFLECGFDDKKIFVVKNPINPSLYLKDNTFRNKYAFNDQTFIFIFCARFLPSKGLMDVLEAMKMISSKFQNIHLFCIGDGPDMEKAQLFVNHNKLSSIVTFTNFIEEIETRYYYSNADALVFPTYHSEGFPMVVFQSLAAGLPILTTQIRAAADYLKEPDNVLWVEPKSPESISQAMNALLVNQDLKNTMSINNKLLSQEFTSKKNAFEYMSIFDKLINS